jgi:hypothetical protein
MYLSVFARGNVHAKTQRGQRRKEEHALDFASLRVLIEAPPGFINQEIVFLVTQFCSVIIGELRRILMPLIDGVGLGAKVRQHMMSAAGRAFVT